MVMHTRKSTNLLLMMGVDEESEDMEVRSPPLECIRAGLLSSMIEVFV